MEKRIYLRLVEREPKRVRDLKNFGLVIAAAVSLVFGVLLPWLFGNSRPIWPWVFSFIFMLLALAIPRWLKLPMVVWLKFSHILGWINIRILLTFFFFLIMVPVGFIMRLLRNDPMSRSFDRAVQTYRIKLLSRDIKEMERPF